MCTLRVKQVHPYIGVLVITVFGLCGVSLGAGKDTCMAILARGCAPVWHDARWLARSFECGALRQSILGHMSTLLEQRVFHKSPIEF